MGVTVDLLEEVGAARKPASTLVVTHLDRQ
jgi:hypothetical protein